MKQLIKQIFCVIVLCALVAGLDSCKKEDTQDKVVNPSDVDLADLTWDLDFPYEVYMSPGAAQELKDSYSDFIEAPVSAISDKTYMVILDNLSDLPEKQLVDLYVDGVVIAIIHPKKAELEALFSRNPEMGSFLDDDGIDGAKLVAISSWNNGLYIIPDEAQFAASRHSTRRKKHRPKPTPRQTSRR